MTLKRRTPWVYVSPYGLYYRVWDGHLQAVEDDGFGSISSLDAADVRPRHGDTVDWDSFCDTIQEVCGWVIGVDCIVTWEGLPPTPPLPVYASDDMLIIPNQ